jgi:hypothetical protein
VSASRDGPATSGALRRARVQSPAVFDQLLADAELSGVQIDVDPPKAARFTPAKPSQPDDAPQQSQFVILPRVVQELVQVRGRPHADRRSFPGRLPQGDPLRRPDQRKAAWTRRKLHQSHRIRDDQTPAHRRLQPRQHGGSDPDQRPGSYRTTSTEMITDDLLEHHLNISVLAVGDGALPALIDLVPVSDLPLGSTLPWDLVLDPGGRFLYVADEKSGTLSTFAVDPRTGKIRPTGAVASTGSPVCFVLSAHR